MPFKKIEELKFSPLNLDGVLGKPKNRVARLGVELEGAWKVLPDQTRLEPDGSVYKDPVTGARKAPQGHQVGELPIGPIQPAAMPRFMRKYYPHKVDKTCGMHVHMSFESVRHYAVLMDSHEYQDTVTEYLTRWAKAEGFPESHHIYERLSGKSVFCQRKFWPDMQYSAKKDHDQERPGHRYTIVHYCGRQMTIEVRVLPMMDTVDQAIRGVKEVYNITNACLVVLGRKKEQKERTTLEIPNGEVYEEFIEEGL